MININAVRKIIDPIDKAQSHPEFDIKFAKQSSGAIVRGRVVCKSTNWTKDMVTIKFIGSGEIRNIRALQILEFNGERVIL